MKPLIGITSNVEKGNKHTLYDSYLKAVQRAGGIPIIIPVGIEEDLSQLTALLDGIVLSGGHDIDPMLFGEEPHRDLGDVSPARDSIEIALAQEMLKLDKPIIGVCRGLQVLNVAIGGNMYQDIYAQNDKPILQHTQKSVRSHLSHIVQVKKGSLFESIAGSTEIKVNSYHHQAVKDVPAPFIVSGVASDGIIEVIESTKHQFVIGVQWHPEELSANGDAISYKLFDKFIEAATKGGNTK
ncbi:gamma-glutamyl-gamma-aminobutyrate hydrolase family protein [Sporosarcina sp. G11-34]|uniref:gamma-glutamyl-gamma-aminobutyrate hydrolase family protein n=1 Tax=Sporosarcina sp. G11-34 TaxID=2849605 RepID=UPI0022A9B1CF|nr:gamma-glutamyl-gamma-aminobutyrate hydrolase family protein [Sporosarcina sp. G11-34]MCZ2257736.1 gamma-glutamyl-gamma-aminobutyrate hydrolase family protein [Sporosarcina sp. G11-34]